MEQRFKKTPAGEIPVDWEVSRLLDVATIIMGQSPPSSSYNKNGIGLPFYQGNADFGRIFPTLNNWCAAPKKQAEKGDILISVRAPVGEVNIAPQKCCIGRGLAVLRPQGIDSNYLYYILIYSSTLLNNLSQGSTFGAINSKELSDLQIPIPPKREQKEIGLFLSNVDEAIDKTDAVIEKTRELKKGLMQQLLTKGIQRGRSKSQDFKDTEIGKIPKHWDILPAEQVCKRVTDGTHDTPKPANTGYFLVTSKNIKNGNIDFSDAYLINNSDFNEANKRSKVDSYDVLFSMIGTIGETTIVPDDNPHFAIKNIGLFKTNENKWLALWLHYYFCSKFAQSYINSNVKGSSQKYLPLYSLRNFPIIVPPPLEQKKIAEVLSTVDNEITHEEEHKSQLDRIKKALMGVLLTGKVRV